MKTMTRSARISDGARRARRIGAAAAVALAAGTLLTPTALAGPEGEVIVVGNVTIQRIGNEWIITASDGAVIHYDSFDILAGEIVRFVQPSEFARVLNRITGGEPTFIDGTLIANGRVYIVNPAGVVFGQNSVVNVGSIYAAAANLSDADFAAGVDNFTDASGAVTARGVINAKDFVGLIGAQVFNHGRISAPQGTVVMAAGDRVLIGEQLGSLYVLVEGAPGGAAGAAAGVGMASGDIYSLAAWQDGTITARRAHIESTGATRVSGVINSSGQTGGSVSILGDTVEVLGARIDAAGTNGGGTVVIGGERAAGGRARTTIIDAGSTVRADATGNGDGGSILIEAIDRLEVWGDATANGGATGGNGGSIRTLSDGALVVTGRVEASAPNGANGAWLARGEELLIAGGTAAGVIASGGASVMNADTINQAISTGTDVTIEIEGDLTQLADARLLKGDGPRSSLSVSAGGDMSLLGGFVTTNTGDPVDAAFLAGGRLLIANGMDMQRGTLRLEGASVEVTRTNTLGNPVLMRVGTMDVVARDGGTIAFSPLLLLVQGDGSGRGLRVEGGVIDVDALIRSTDGAGVEFLNSGLLTFATGALLDLDGSFAQAGEAVRLGADIFTTGDDITFGGAVTLIDDVLLDAFDGSGAMPEIRFARGVEDDGSGRDLIADAGYGSIVADGAIGGSSPLRSLSLRAARIRVDDATTLLSQRYIADEVTFIGTTYTTLGFDGGDGPRGDDGGPIDASIRVLGDAGLGFAGRTVLAGDASFTTAGGAADDVEFASTVQSVAGGFHTLRIDAGDGLAIFGGTVGDAAGSDARLGFVEVAAAREAKLFGSVFTSDGFSWWVPVELHAPSTVLHVGDGVGLFAQHIYAAGADAKGGGGGVDVSFLYDGSAFVRLGEARVPFKFRRSIGADASGSAGRSFGTVSLGGDLDGAAALATFLFASNADAGLSLLDLGTLDLGQSFGIFATEGIEMGRGQKLTSFGSLALVADGPGTTRIGVGDLNVLGDLSVRSLGAGGGEIVFKGRAPGGIEDQSTELARLSGLELALSPDEGAEVIVLGEMEFLADTVSFDGPTQTRFGSLTAGSLLGGLIEVEAVPNLGLGLFTAAGGGVAYPYDLRLFGDPLSPDLGTALLGDAPFDPRYEGRYLAGLEVLGELGLNPREAEASVRRRAAIEGRDVITDQAPPTAAPTEAGIVLTIDRVSRDAVTALADAYIGLLGPRVGEDGTSRARTDEVRSALGDAWDRYGGSADGFGAWLQANDQAAFGVLTGMGEVVARLEDLGLPRFEQRVAESRLAELLRPASMPADAFEAAIGLPAPRVAAK